MKLAIQSIEANMGGDKEHIETRVKGVRIDNEYALQAIAGIVTQMSYKIDPNLTPSAGEIVLFRRSAQDFKDGHNMRYIQLRVICSELKDSD